MPFDAPVVTATAGTPFVEVEGTFYRAIDPAFRDYAIAGSRAAGRYSRFDQPTLYLSSSPEGVAAAMLAHKDHRSENLSLISVQVSANRILDLRDEAARTAAGIALDDATAPWQEILAEGGSPRSWKVRAQLEAIGAQGLIDPSRKEPRLWHLVLFAWNRDGAARVDLLD
nr:RES domain-containing protein [uncultured Cohaesibacter sp.]